MRVLLHICCAPCAIYPLKKLSDNGRNKVTGFFYNPNIHPAEEFERRRDALTIYSKNVNFNVIFGESAFEIFFKEIGTRQEVPERCAICWSMRLKKTAEYARDNQYDAFTTTLLVSPYQDHEEIMRIGLEYGKTFGIDFIAADFRSGFKQAQDEAKEQGIYRQKYCGCIFSREK